MDSLLVDVPPLPTFANGYPLEANALNRLATVQDYVNQRLLRPISLMPLMVSGQSYWIVRTHRYLRYVLQQNQSTQARTARLLVGGKRALELSYAANTPTFNVSGYIDLAGTDLDGQPYNLPYSQRYEVTLVLVSGEDSIVPLEIHEWPNTTGTLVAPASIPSFANGQTLDAAKLNALSQNTSYLLYGGGFAPNGGFPTSKSLLPAPGGLVRKRYRMRYVHRYLRVLAQTDMGYNANDVTLRVFINSTQIYTDTKSKTGTGGGVVHSYTLALDLNSVGPVAGNFYTITIEGQMSQWDLLAALTVVWAGQSPDPTLPVF